MEIEDQIIKKVNPRSEVQTHVPYSFVSRIYIKNYNILVIKLILV